MTHSLSLIIEASKEAQERFLEQFDEFQTNRSFQLSLKYSSSNKSAL
ncbi:MAG: hypothetical protein ACI9T7_003237 [Oleiphilaceae bacterium]|jgi:hypothetical protein